MLVILIHNDSIHRVAVKKLVAKIGDVLIERLLQTKVFERRHRESFYLESCQEDSAAHHAESWRKSCQRGLRAAATSGTAQEWRLLCARHLIS